jgi:hypothetical protein
MGVLNLMKDERNSFGPKYCYSMFTMPYDTRQSTACLVQAVKTRPSSSSESLLESHPPKITAKSPGGQSGSPLARTSSDGRLEQAEDGLVMKLRMVSGIQLMHVSLPKALQRTSTPGLHAREEVTHSANSAGISASKRQSSGEQTSASGALRLFIEASEATTIEAVAVKCQFGIHASQNL